MAHPAVEFVAVLSVLLLVRFITGLSGYSGADDPPKYGDYEAQRHWMEITVNLPIQDWYRETPDNNLKHWGLDYPPLSAYQSWLYGQAVGVVDPMIVALHHSRGYESYVSKLLMRWTVVASDVLFFFPAALACLLAFSRGSTRPAQLFLLAAIALQPAALLIDHAHFQYNGISLGFSAAAAAAIAGGQYVAGSVLYCLALNHKQMALFYAPAFFGHLLGRCLQSSTVAGKVLAVAKLGVAVIGTFALCWAPYLASLEDTLQVLSRIFPVGRGLYEDYVANFWCASSLLVKWKELLPTTLLMRLCMACVVLASLPSMVHQVCRPSRRGLLYAMANSGWAFFMFSYQVHEKSVLLPLLPMTLLALQHPLLATWLPLLASFSMFPLLERDGASLAYIGTNLLYLALMQLLLPHIQAAAGQQQQAAAGGKSKRLPQLAVAAVALAALWLHAAKAAVPAPARYPWLWDRGFISLAAAVFAPVALYLNVQQWRLPLEQLQQKQKQS